MHELALQDKTTQDRDKTISVLRDKKAAYKNQVFATHTAPVGVDALRGNTDNIHRRARTHARTRAHTHTHAHAGARYDAADNASDTEAGSRVAAPAGGCSRRG